MLHERTSMNGANAKSGWPNGAGLEIQELMGTAIGHQYVRCGCLSSSQRLSR
jgi:hypothetical protein